jgi:nitroreductase
MMMRFMLGSRGAAYVAELAPETEHFVSLFNDGTDWILREPPVLILFCADSAAGEYMSINANIALQNAALAAESLGLDCFCAGFVLMAGIRGDSIERHISLPETR